MTKKKLPNVVYVYYDYDGGGAYLLVCETMDEVAEKGNRILVGIYNLESLVNVSLEVKLEQVK